MEKKEPELNPQQDESDTLEGEDSNRILFTRKFEPPHVQPKKEEFLKNLIESVAGPEIASKDLSDELYLFTKNIFIKSIKANLKKISNKKPKNEPESVGLTREERKLSFREIAGIIPKKKIKYIRAYKKMKIDNKNVIVSILAEKLKYKYFLNLVKYLKGRLLWDKYQKEEEEAIKTLKNKILNQENKKILISKESAIKSSISENLVRKPIIPFIEQIKKEQLFFFLRANFQDLKTRLKEKVYDSINYSSYNYIKKNIETNQKKIDNKYPNNLFESKNLGSKKEVKKLSLHELLALKQKGELKNIRIYKKMKIVSINGIIYTLTDNHDDINSLKLLLKIH